MIMYLILPKQKLNKNVLVDISEPHFFFRERKYCRAICSFAKKNKEFTPLGV